MDRLEARGLLRRAPAEGDRRAYALEVTAEGATLYRTIARAIAAHEDRVFAQLDQSERALLHALLARLALPDQ